MKLDPRSLEVGPEPRASCVSFESHFPIQEAAVQLNDRGRKFGPSNDQAKLPGFSLLWSRG